MRPFITQRDPALAIVAAAALAASNADADLTLAEDTLRRYAEDSRDQGTPWRLQVARALGDVRNPAFRSLLVPLMYDADLEVARAAIESAGLLGGDDFLVVPPLVSLMRNRRLKSAARAVLTGYGESVVAPLAYFMRDREEDKWVRRHVPSTLAALPFPASVAALLDALDDPDGFIRYKAVAALDRLHRVHPELVIDKAIATRHANVEAARAFNALTLHYNLFVAGGIDRGTLLSRALNEKYTRALNRTLTLLGLVHGTGDVAAVRHSLRVGDARQRSRAIEYLDNLLEGDSRKRVMLLIDEMPEDERIRKGNVLYRTRTRDVEDTLAQLLHDEDQSIASAAVLLVADRKVWTLADDLEYVLAHRDVRDQDVFEAASWALAASRMDEQRRKALWLEPLPAVELADRLRNVPLFHFTDVNELFRLARLGRQVRYETGRALYQRGGPVDSVQFLLDGRVTITGRDGARDLRAPLALGVEELLEGAPMSAAVTAEEPSITLLLSANDFLTLLSENVELAEGIFRMMIESRSLVAGHTLIRGSLAPDLKNRTVEDLRPVDRVLLMQSSPLLAHATAAQLWGLSAIAQPLAVEPGKAVIERGGEAAILIVLSGSLAVDAPDGGGTATAGDVIGMYETLAGVTLDASVTAINTAHVLRLDRDALFELLADYTDLLQGVFSKLLRQRAADQAVAAP